jgi:hypothetical protein
MMSDVEPAQDVDKLLSKAFMLLPGHFFHVLLTKIAQITNARRRVLLISKLGVTLQVVNDTRKMIAEVSPRRFEKPFPCCYEVMLACVYQD